MSYMSRQVWIDLNRSLKAGNSAVDAAWRVATETPIQKVPELAATGNGPSVAVIFGISLVDEIINRGGSAKAYDVRAGTDLSKKVVRERVRAEVAQGDPDELVAPPLRTILGVAERSR